MYILSVIPMICYGQVDINKAFEALKKAEDQTSIIETAVLPDLSVIRQQYRLKRNGEYFGKNHKPYYGESYTLGVKVSGGTLLLSDVVEPWNRDADYKRDNASGNYVPSPYLSYQRSILEKEYKPVNFEISDSNGFLAPINSDKSLYFHTDVIGDFGLTIDKAYGEKNGYMLWAYSLSNVQDSAMNVKFSQSTLQLDIREDSQMKKIVPLEIDNVIGGIFVTPKYERGGRVQFLLSGVAVRSASDEWYLQLMCAEENITKQVSSNEAQESSNEGNKKSNSEKKTDLKDKRKQKKNK